MTRRPPPFLARLLPAVALALVPPVPTLAQQPQQPGASSRPATASPRPPAASAARVTLNFVNANIEAVTRAIGAMLERQIIVDPRVKGTVTVYSEQPLSVREAYFNYLAALRGLGFTVVENAGLLKVVPEADAKLQTSTVSLRVGEEEPQAHTKVFSGSKSGCSKKSVFWAV